MVPAKLILQEAWATEANWDLPLPDELQSRFSVWYHGLSCISQLKFERRIEQKKHFQEKENSVHGLQVVRGDDDVLRVKTRIIERDDDLSFLYPILLPSKHYLTECLIRRISFKKAKATCQELKVGDIVLIEMENKKRVMWPMGKIEKIYSSRDGASRVVRVRTSSGCLTRPIQKLYPLEVSTSGDPVLTLTTENRSRYGRLFKSSKK
ncbi:DUF5641 domain-containing protein [Caerostris extrusa]|uniref:DUF5641 domain-containing protein n=1 Tax=Caerostris extrusa TaxID=172846 RepID=A0AAV4VEA4_CAEEX|nr:DUF5641 domain-containing protein [Caerostris extrusa]